MTMIQCPTCLRERSTESLSRTSERLWLCLYRIRCERARQDEKWGEQNHEDETWLAILMEEVGELAEAILHRRFGGGKASHRNKELVQVAAVAIAWMECIERRELK